MCASQSEKLTEYEIQERLSTIPEWTWEGKKIRRRYKLASFPEAIAFCNQIAHLAEEKNHHPFISIDYKMVTLELTSWHAGGLTNLDFVLATAFDHTFLSQLHDFRE